MRSISLLLVAAAAIALPNATGQAAEPCVGAVALEVDVDPSVVAFTAFNSCHGTLATSSSHSSALRPMTCPFVQVAAVPFFSGAVGVAAAGAGALLIGLWAGLRRP